jgi:RNA polymerase sigma-70 factor, ECF subfamily
MRTSPFARFTSIFALTDEQAMWRVQTQDDATAFAQLVGRWESPIQRLCTRMTGDTHRGQDLAQDTFVKVFAQRKNYQPSGRFSSYLWRIALNICYDELRRIRRRGESSLHDESEDGFALLDSQPAADPGPDRLAVAEERAESVRQALLQLPETYRTVLILRHYEDLKFREIAEVLNIPEGTVKSRMAEALNQLGRLLVPKLNDKANHLPRPIRHSNRERLLI